MKNEFQTYEEAEESLIRDNYIRFENSDWVFMHKDDALINGKIKNPRMIIKNSIGQFIIIDKKYSEL